MVEKLIFEQAKLVETNRVSEKFVHMHVRVRVHVCVHSYILKETLWVKSQGWNLEKQELMDPLPQIKSRK